MAIVDRRWSALPVPYAMEFPDRARKERYFDPDFYQMEVELLWPRVWQMACRLEEIPQARRLRRVRDLRSVDHRGAHRRPGRAGLPERLPPSRRQGRRGSRDVRERVHLPVPRVVLRPRRQEHLRHTGEDVRRAQPAARGPQPHAGAVRGMGRLRVDQPGRRRSAPAAVHRAVRHHPRRLEGGVAADRVVVRLPSPGQLEARRRGVHGAVPRGRRRIPSWSSPGRYPPRNGGGDRPAYGSSMRRSTTSAR